MKTRLQIQKHIRNQKDYFATRSTLDLSQF